MADEFGRQSFTPAPVAESGEALDRQLCHRVPNTYATFMKRHRRREWEKSWVCEGKVQTRRARNVSFCNYNLHRDAGEREGGEQVHEGGPVRG